LINYQFHIIMLTTSMHKQQV